MVQTRLVLDRSDDAHEREARSAAHQSTRRPDLPAAPPIAAVRLPDGGGDALPPPDQAALELRLGVRLPGLRVHAGPAESASADALGARAYTTGEHVVLGRHAPDLRSAAGRQLLVHEAMHVLAVREGRVPAGVVRRDGPPASGPAPSARFDDVRRQFDILRFNSRDAEAAALVPELLRLAEAPDILAHGAEIAFWLMDRGDWPQAQSALDRLEAAWRRTATVGAHLVLRNLAGPTVLRGGPRDLLDRAKTEATARHTDAAFRLFGLAYLFAQFLLQGHDVRRTEQFRATEERLESIFGPGTQGRPDRLRFLASASVVGRIFSYGDVSTQVAILREVVGFYPGLEREALARGDSTAAAMWSTLGFALQTELRDSYTVTTSGAEAIALETTRTRTAAGTPAYVLHGAQGREEAVTPLPGEPTPDELGATPAFRIPVGEVGRVLTEQEEFVTALFRYPEIRAAFPGARIDLRNQDQRLRVWAAMYRAFQRETSFGSPLTPLVRLVERYLGAFTMHTRYDISDFRVNYLTTEFPEDLLGRAVRDCGVYALTVAHELYRTARSATPRLPLSFELFSLTDHVALVVKAAEEHYVVNNDRILGPFTGDVITSFGQTYARTTGRGYVVSPGVLVPLTSTAVGDATFRRQAWAQFRLSAQWGLAVPPRTPADPRSEGERREETYRQYYQALKDFDGAMRGLDARLNELARDLRAAPTGQRAARASTGLAPLLAPSPTLRQVFDALGPHARLVSDNPRLVGATQQWVFAQRREGPHPLTRLAMAVEFARSAGARIDQVGDDLVTWIREPGRAVGGGTPPPVKPSFVADLDDYLRRGRPLPF